MLIGYGGYEHEASREEVMRLIEKWKIWHPESTDADAEEALQAMSSGERARMATGHHEMDQGQAAPSNACAVDYDPLPSSQGPIDGALPAPSGAPSKNRGWY